MVSYSLSHSISDKFISPPIQINMLENMWHKLGVLLNKVHTTDSGFLDDLPTLPIIPKLDDPPSFDKVEKVILSLKDNKAAGPDNIPVEVIKFD